MISTTAETAVFLLWRAAISATTEGRARVSMYYSGIVNGLDVYIWPLNGDLKKIESHAIYLDDPEDPMLDQVRALCTHLQNLDLRVPAAPETAS